MVNCKPVSRREAYRVISLAGMERAFVFRERHAMQGSKPDQNVRKGQANGSESSGRRFCFLLIFRSVQEIPNGKMNCHRNGLHLLDLLYFSSYLGLFSFVIHSFQHHNSKKNSILLPSFVPFLLKKIPGLLTFKWKAFIFDLV